MNKITTEIFRIKAEMATLRELIDASESTGQRMKLTNDLLQLNDDLEKLEELFWDIQRGNQCS